MSQYKDVAVGSTVYFWFAANTTAGAAGDGATPLYDVRLAGASASGAPTASGTPTLLTHANYTDGLHEIAIDTTGYAAGEYAVFCTLTISSVNPAGFCGSFVVRSASSTLYDFVSAIKTKTDNLPSDPADESSIQATLTTIAAYLDTEVAAIKAKTDQLTFTTANKLDATIQAAGDFAQAAADKVWATAARTLTAFGFSVTVGTNSDKVGYSLSSGGIQAIWDALTSALSTTNSIGKLIVDNVNATISSRATQTSVDTVAGFLDTEIAAIKAKTDNLPAAPAAVGDIPTANQIADQVWDEAIAGHLTGGSTGAALNGAGSSGDPWTASLPGAYGAGTAGKIIGDNINATIASRASQSALDTLDDYVDTEVAAIKAKTDNLPASPAAVGSAMTLATDSVNAAAIAADAVTEIQVGLATPAQVLTQVNAALSAARTELASVPTTTGGLAEKIDFIFEYFRNRKTVTATTETLFKEDASTPLGTATLSDDATTATKGEMN